MCSIHTVGNFVFLIPGSPLNSSTAGTVLFLVQRQNDASSHAENCACVAWSLYASWAIFLPICNDLRMHKNQESGNSIGYIIPQMTDPSVARVFLELLYERYCSICHGGYNDTPHSKYFSLMFSVRISHSFFASVAG